jgi:hypothetical protein
MDFIDQAANRVPEATIEGFNGAQGTVRGAISGFQAGIGGGHDAIRDAISTGIQAEIRVVRETVQGAVNEGLQVGILSGQEILRDAIGNSIQSGISGVQESVVDIIKKSVKDGIQSADDTERFLRWWNEFLGHIVTVSIFGGSITFTVVVQQIQDPAELNGDTKFHKETVRKFLAVAWLLFVTSLALSVVSSLLLLFDREAVHRAFRGSTGSFWAVLFHILSFLLCAVLLGAFMVLSLCVVAYVKGVGWAGCAVTSFTAVIALICWAWQGLGICCGTTAHG